MFDESAIIRMAEAKIREAMENGEFDNLPGQGKPLELEDLSQVPEELRAAYIMLKNANLLPEELELNKEIVSLERLVDSCVRDDEKKRLWKILLQKRLHYDILMERGQKKSRSRKDRERFR